MWSDAHEARHTERSEGKQREALAKPSPATDALAAPSDACGPHSVGICSRRSRLRISAMSSLASNKLEGRNKTLKQKRMDTMVAKRRRHRFQCTSTRCSGMDQFLELGGGESGKDGAAPILGARR